MGRYGMPGQLGHPAQRRSLRPGGYRQPGISPTVGSTVQATVAGGRWGRSKVAGDKRRHPWAIRRAQCQFDPTRPTRGIGKWTETKERATIRSHYLAQTQMEK
jgi:hypothetical protein